MTEITTISIDVVAIYAALLSTIAFSWQIYNEFFRDRAIIKVEAHAGGFIEMNPKPQLIVSIINRGRRPATINSIWITIPKKGMNAFFAPHWVPNLPQKLEEGESTTITAPFEFLSEELYKNISNCKVGVKDATNKVYYSNVIDKVLQFGAKQKTSSR